jgi:hypothetical protein
MPARYFGGYQNIYAGSSYGTPPFPAATPIVTSPTGATIYEASKQIIISNNFLASPTTGYFLAQVDPKTCGDPCRLPPIVSLSSFCIGYGYTFTNAALGGTWMSTNPAVATVNNITGLVVGLSAGTTIIRYILDDCAVSTIVEILPSPCGGGIGSGKPGFNGSSDEEQFSTTKLIVVFPIPTTGNITISYPCNQAGQLDISIKDVSGRTRHTESVSCNEGDNMRHAIDISDFSPGVYFADISLNDQHVIKKIIKL